MALVNKQRRPTNFVLYQGEDFYFYHRMTDDEGTPIDITNYVFEMQIRKDYSDATPLIELTEGNGRITHEDDSDGLILVHITAADTAALEIDIDCSYTDPPSEEWVYDLEADAGVFPPGKQRTLQGKIKAIAEVTK